MRGVTAGAGLVRCILAFGVAATALLPAQLRADDAAETGMGIVYGETEMAKGVCPGLQLDEAARARLMAEKAVDPAKPTNAFKQGVAEADQRSAEAIANERLRSFCLEMREAYGDAGKSVPGLLRDK